MPKLPPVILAAQGVFHTIQGEGHLAGQPMTFVRLAGCSVACRECDTDYTFDRRESVEQIVDEVDLATPSEVRDRWCWVTGGEPADQAVELSALVRGLRRRGFSVAVATSGVRRIAVPVDWLSVSPHAFELTVRSGNEIKLIPGLNGLDAEQWIEENDATIDFWLRFLQPLEGDESSLSRCLAIRERFPHWGITLQTHKYMGLP